MRTLGLVVVVIVFALVLLVLIPPFARWCAKAELRHEVSKLRKAEKNTPWTYYSRFSQGKNRWVVGVERVSDTLVMNRVEIYEFPPDVDSLTVVQAEGEAIARAGEYNRNRTGM